MAGGRDATTAGSWPELPLSAWQDTKDTLHLWTQVVGKVKLALEPMINHWWQTTFQVTARGLSTGLMPYGNRAVEITFDFRRHVLDIATTDADNREVALRPRSVADFYAETHDQLNALGMPVAMLARPVEVPVAIPFEEDEQHASYDARYVHAFWLSLVHAHRVFTEFRAGYVGKVSPVQFFWGAFDLAVTRFSGRRAPRHPGGIPNCADWVTQEAYSHEVSSCGYWPGAGAEGAFYSYAYPEPDAFAGQPITPTGTWYDGTLKEFVLPYEVVRRAENPDQSLLSFLRSTYDAASRLGDWDRPALERDGPR